MKISLRPCLFALAGVFALAAPILRAQESVPLYAGNPPGSADTSYPEKQYFSQVWHTDVVSNVTRPTLTVFKPAEGTKTGSAIVICPGGGFMALSITSEGTDVARYLAARGMTAFVLKYRLAHTGDDATAEFRTLWEDKPRFAQVLRKTVPHSIADGVAAVAWVRSHASEYGVSPDRVGIIGFSAGGTVAAGVGFHYKPDSRPAFVAPIYAGDLFKTEPVPADAPPLFLAAATDDNLGLAPDSITLYNQWTAAHHPAELHMFAKGGHGFGMHQQNLPTDHWIDRFADWLTLQGFLDAPTKSTP